MFKINKRLKFSKRDGIVLLLTALVTAIASEIKVIPFNGESFRFGLGSVTFFLLLLIRPPASLLQTGFVTGLTVVCFRLVEEMLINEVSILTSVITHLPAFLFYFLFALGFHMIKIEKYKTSPLLLGAWATAFEFIGNSAEQLMRQGLLGYADFQFQDWGLLVIVALFRSYFVVGLYSSITVSEQEKRMQEMLEVGSELYAETLYLQKSMNQIEKITVSSYDLYRKLKIENHHELSVKALQITQEIHEVKKDSQRILAGLSKITHRRKSDVFLLSDVLNLVITGNEKYSEFLKKQINFHSTLSVNFETDQYIALLALLNNLTANSVESIQGEGDIRIEMDERAGRTYFYIEDSGTGIPKEDLEIIFEPGYTTKFNKKGVAATGIGLSHVLEIVETLNGEIQFESLEQGTVFRIQVPTKNIRK